MREGHLKRRSQRATAKRRRSHRVRALVAFIAAVAAVSLVTPAQVAHAQSLGFTEYPLSSGFDEPLSIVTGPDGNLWFTELTGPNIGTITPTGTITEYPIPNYSGFLGTGGVAAGSDGNLWFTDLSNNTVGKITTGGSITEYAALSTASANPESITAGPDGNLWFTEQSANFVGKVTTGGTITEYAITANASSQQIAAGPDGDLWFAEQGLDKIGRITPTGTYAEFALAAGAQPTGIVAGPDGNIWVTEAGTGDIDKLSLSGTVLAQYPVLTSGATPSDLSVGPDSNLWFTENGGSAIGSITSGGAITEYPTGSSGGTPFGITGGPDGNIWYTEYNGDAIGKFSLGPCARLDDAVSQTPVGPGATETVSLTVTSCGVATLQNATTATTVTSPPGCPTAPAIPSFMSTLTYGQTDPHPTTFAAPSCPGPYSLSSQTTVGRTVISTAQTSYTVIPVGGGVLFSAYPRPAYVTAGSDGNIWYTDSSNNVNRVTPSGTITPFNVLPSGGNQITSGPDGNLYVVGSVRGQGDSVAQVNILGCCGPFFTWQVQPSGGMAINDIEPGVDGNVWFAAGTNPSGVVGFVTPGAKFHQFKLPAGSGTPTSITAGPDNAMWFTLDSDQVGRITTAGTVTLFAEPAGIGGGDIALGPDGNLWMTAGAHGGPGNEKPNYIITMSPTGAVIREETTPTADVSAGGITAGADGNLWFNEPFLPRTADCPHGFGGGVGRVTATGVITEFGAGCNDTNDQFNIVAGPDGNVWNGAYYGIGINMTEVGWSGACTPLTASAGAANVRRGAPETIAATIANCATTPQLMQLQTKTISASTCGSATTTTRVPLSPHVGTLVSSASSTRCKGTYGVKLTLRVGSHIVATKTVTYTVS